MGRIRTVKMISIINQGGDYAIAAYYNEYGADGNITKTNAKAPVFYATGEVLSKISEIESTIKERINKE